MIDVPRDDLVLMLEAGYLYLAMSLFNEARQVFEGVIALSPNHEIPKVALANVLFAQRKFLPAIRILKEALAVNPNSAFAHAHLGESLLFYGKKEESIQELKIAIKSKDAGKAGEFATSLLELINQGYDPVKLREETARSKEEKK